MIGTNETTPIVQAKKVSLRIDSHRIESQKMMNILAPLYLPINDRYKRNHFKKYKLDSTHKNKGNGFGSARGY